MAQEYDMVMKKLAEIFPTHLVQLVRKTPVSDVYREEKEAVATRRDSDNLFHVTEAGFKYLMALEVQISPDTDIPRRLLEYTAMQHREFKLPVYPVVLNLTGQQQKDTYILGCLDLPTAVTFHYRVINLIDVPGQDTLEHGPVGLIPLVPLMKHDESPEVVLEKCSKRVEEAPVEWQPDLYLILAVLASALKKLPKETINKIIGVSKMEASPLFDGIREKWIEDGKIEGKTEGKKEVICRFLAARFGVASADVQEKVKNVTDLEVLDPIITSLFAANTLDEARSIVGDGLSKEVL